MKYMHIVFQHYTVQGRLLSASYYDWHLCSVFRSWSLCSVYRSCSLCSVSEAEVCVLFSEAEVCVLFSEAEACVLFTEAVVCVLFSEAEGRYQDEEQQRGWRGGDAEPRGHGQGAHSPQLHPHQIRGQWPSGRRQQSGQTRRLHSGHLLREGWEQHGTQQAPRLPHGHTSQVHHCK